VAVLQDLTFALRSLRKAPSFTLTAIATVAVGIGSTVAILSVVQAVLVDPLPYPEPDRLTVFWAEWPAREVFRLSHTGNDFREYQRRAEGFEGIAALGSLRQNLGGLAEPVQVQVGWISENFFSVMRVAPVLGRDFAEDEPPGSVLLGYALWQRQFGGDPAVLGRTLELDRKPYVVVGVLPRGFRLWLAADVGIGTDIDLWKPADPVASPGRWKAAELDQSTLRILARLKPNVTLAQAQAEMDSISEALRRSYPDHDRVQFRVAVASLAAEVSGNVRPSLLALLGAVGLVLLVACANVASLQLVRAQYRRGEIAIRASLGGSPARIVRQLWIESLVLALAGGALGTVLGSLGVRALLAIDSGKLPRVENVHASVPVLATALAITLGATFLFGLLPAVESARPDLVAFASARRTANRGSRRLTETLVVAEIALSLMLLVGAGLLLRSFVHLREIRPGFDPNGLLTFSISLPSVDYPPPVETAQFLKRFEEHLEALPGVVSVGTVWPLPLEGQKWFGYYRTTDTASNEDSLPVADFRLSSPGYLRTLGARLIEGRYPREEDREQVLVDEKLASSHWPAGRATGNKLWIHLDGGPVEAQVVGVVENIRHADLTKDGRETIYLPARAFTWADFELAVVVRTAGDPRSLVPAVRGALAALDPKIPMSKVRTADQYVADAMAPNRLALVLAAIFASMALVLAGVGLYGVMAYCFARRAREIGIRMSFGAGKAAIARLVLGRGLLLTLAGLLLGTMGIHFLRGIFKSLLFQTDPGDFWTQAATAAILGVTALAGSLGPARRAVRVDPAVALRTE
jgi:putative ABC transport system permease protein